jgi:asparagine synthase (glutamine-hydrolysing)
LALVISNGIKNPSIAAVIAAAWGAQPSVVEAGAATFFCLGEEVRLPECAGPDGRWVAHRSRLHVPIAAPDGGARDPMEAAWSGRGDALFDDLVGDWCLFGWDPAARQLTAARDQCGFTELFWWSGPEGFAVATDLPTLRALPFVSAEPDELAVARGLFGQYDPTGSTSLLRDVRRVPFGHVLVWTTGRVAVRRYWDPAGVRRIRLPDDRDYVHAFREIATRAVRDRLGSTGPVACHLSSGLDSGTVASIAGALLHAQGRDLIALTAAPHITPAGFPDRALADEWPLAAETAAAVPGCRHIRIEYRAQTVLGALRSWLDAGGEPLRNPGALCWLGALAEAGRDHGADTMLTGTFGNAAFSWGDRADIEQTVPLRTQARRLIPAQANVVIDRARRPDWFRHTALHARLADGEPGRILLATERQRDRRRNGQLDLLRANLDCAGGMDNFSRVDRIDTVDPTFDRRLLEFCIGVPTHVFHDPSPGLDRKLVRQATVGLLPDGVRLNRRRGVQSADLVPSLRESPEEMEAALTEVAAGPAAEFVDVAHMRDLWRRTHTAEPAEITNTCSSILLRGLAYGLWINRL